MTQEKKRETPFCTSYTLCKPYKKYLEGGGIWLFVGGVLGYCHALYSFHCFGL